jgi:hypothetical protein
MTAPPREWSRLQKFVWTMRKHGNEPDNLNLEKLASFNDWTTADELLVEFHIQQNGSRKLAEEIAVVAPPTISQSEDEE